MPNINNCLSLTMVLSRITELLMSKRFKITEKRIISCIRTNLPGWLFGLIAFLIIVVHSAIGYTAECTVEIRKANGTVVIYSSPQKAIEAVVAGDTITIPKGVHYCTLKMIRKHGTPDQPIVFKGIDSKQCVIDGALSSKSKMFTWSSHNLTGEIFYSSPFFNKGDIVAARLPTGVRIWSYVNAEEFLYSNISPGIFYDRNQKKILVKGLDPYVQEVFISSSDYTVRIEECSNIIIKNLSVKNGGVASIKILSSRNVILSNLNVLGGKHGIYLKDTDNKPVSMGLQITQCKISEHFNENWYWSDFKHTGAAMEGAGIYIKSSGPGNQVVQCRIEGFFDGIGIAGKNANHNAMLSIRNNIIYNIIDDAIEADSPCNQCQIVGNTIYDTFVGLSLAPVQGPIYVYRNIVSANKRINFKRKSNFKQYGVALKIGGTKDIPSRDANIYNNTLHAISHVVSARYRELETNNFKYLNNIFYTETGYALYVSGLPNNGVFFDRNLYFKSTSGDLLCGWQSLSSKNRLPSLKSATRTQQIEPQFQWELNGIQGDPSLVGIRQAPPNGNLKKNSPAINAGVNVVEAYGWPDCEEIKDGNYDIGAIEISQYPVPPVLVGIVQIRVNNR